MPDRFVAGTVAVVVLVAVGIALQIRAVRSRGQQLEAIQQHLSGAAVSLDQQSVLAKELNERIEGVERAIRGQGEASEAVEMWRWGPPAYKLDEIGGLGEDVKAEVAEIVAQCRGDQRFASLNIPPPRGLLIAGPSGVGKTMLAHAIAAELGRKICVVSGPLLLDHPARVKRLFRDAVEHAPSVVFVDELEAVAEHRRGHRLSGIEAYRHLFLVTLMTELEELGKARVLVVGATNRPDMLEPALLRWGRLERQIHIDLPDAKGREEILLRHRQGRGLPVPEALIRSMAQSAQLDEGTTGFSGADLVDALLGASLQAAARGASQVGPEDVGRALRRTRLRITRQSVNEPENVLARTTADFHMPGETSVRFAAVAGLERPKRILARYVRMLRRYAEFREAGCTLPRGILLSGPPGVGKTLLARAAANEAGLPFFSASASEFVELFVGVGPARVRDLFRLASRQPCVLFIDEIDALGSRGARVHSGADVEYNQTINQFLTELDGFDQRTGVVVIAATNRAALLDQALTRAGRFDFKVELDYPDAAERRAILDIFLNERDRVTKVEELLNHPGLRTGADIAAVVNLARIRSVEEGRQGRVADDHMAQALAEIAPGCGRAWRGGLEFPSASDQSGSLEA